MMKIFDARVMNYLLLVILFHLPTAQAEQDIAIDCTVESYSGTLFTELYRKTQESAHVFCKEFMRFRINQKSFNNTVIQTEFISFAKKAEIALNNKGMEQSADYREQFNSLKKSFADFDFNDIKLPEFKIQPPLVGNDVKGYFQPKPDNDNVDRFTIKQVAHCDSILADSRCEDIFNEFGDAFNPYRSAYNNVYDNREVLSSLVMRWDEFLEASKSQTALEVFLTTLANGDHFKKNHLVGPPGYQIIALHPHLIYNNMEKAPDGSNQELGLAVEWGGVNFWDWKVPFGISVTSVYVDREGADDVGHGVMLHINNHYSIGWAKHDDKDSVYVTIDLLKLFEDKKKQYDDYLSYGG